MALVCLNRWASCTVGIGFFEWSGLLMIREVQFLISRPCPVFISWCRCDQCRLLFGINRYCVRAHERDLSRVSLFLLFPFGAEGCCFVIEKLSLMPNLRFAYFVSHVRPYICAALPFSEVNGNRQRERDEQATRDWAATTFWDREWCGRRDLKPFGRQLYDPQSAANGHDKGGEGSRGLQSRGMEIIRQWSKVFSFFQLRRWWSGRVVPRYAPWQARRDSQAYDFGPTSRWWALDNRRCCSAGGGDAAFTLRCFLPSALEGLVYEGLWRGIAFRWML